jgi:hypothetical protein
MVDWKAALSGKSIGDIENRLSQLTDAEQQQALQLLGNGNQIMQPPTDPIWRLVILNNKIRPPSSRSTDPMTYAWCGTKWPHELVWQRQGGTPGDNTLVLVKTLQTFLRVGLLPLGPNHGPNQPAESVTISLHRAPAPNGAPITAAELTPAVHDPWRAQLMPAPPADVPKWPQGKPIFVEKSPSAPPGNNPANQVAMPTTQTLAGDLPTQQALCPQGLSQFPEQPIDGLCAHVEGLHSLPEIPPPKLQARLAALRQADADSRVPGLLETTFSFYFNVTPQCDIAGGTPHTLLFLRATLVSDPNVFVDTEPFLLESKKDKKRPPKPPKENVGSNEHSSAGSAKRQKGAGLSTGAGPSSPAAAGPSSGGAGPELEQENPELNRMLTEAIAEMKGNSSAGAGSSSLGAIPDGQEDGPGVAQLGHYMLAAMIAEASDDEMSAEASDDEVNYGELGSFEQEPNLLPPGEGEGGGGAGGADSPPQTRSCAAADSAPSIRSCSAAAESPPRYRGGLGGTSGGDAGGEAGLESQQSAMRRVRRAMRDNAKALLLAILRAAGAQQQQQPGATPLAQLREELEDLKAWLGL